MMRTPVADRVAQPDDEVERSRARAAPADAASDAFTCRRSPGDALPAAAARDRAAAGERSVQPAGRSLCFFRAASFAFCRSSASRRR